MSAPSLSAASIAGCTPNAPAGDTVDLRRVAAFGGLDTVRATYVRHSFSPHFHETFAIGLMLRGACAMECRGETYLLREGHLVFLSPGDVHTGQQVGECGWSYCAIYPAAETVAALATDTSGRASPSHEVVFRSPVVRDATMAHAFVALHKTLYEGCAVQQETATLDFLASVVARHVNRVPAVGLERTHRSHYAMRAVRDYMQAHHADALTVQTLADVAGLSCFYTVRLFRATFGISPHAYLAILRVHQARMLIRGGASIAEAALAAGFNDQSHLTRFFKRVFGTTPGVYAKATRPR